MRPGRPLASRRMRPGADDGDSCPGVAGVATRAARGVPLYLLLRGPTMDTEHERLARAKEPAPGVERGADLAWMPPGWTSSGGTGDRMIGRDDLVRARGN